MSSPTIDELRRGFTLPSAEGRPMLRWWWFGPSLRRDELVRELDAIAAAGFGGVEIAYVYPLGPVDDAFLSDTFCSHLLFVAERARHLGLSFDLTLGSGWSFGGPHISPELAAKKLHWETREIQMGALDVPVVEPWPGDVLVAAYVGDGTSQEPPDVCEQLPIVDGVIRVPEGRGPRLALLAYSRLTGQSVKRAAVGAEGAVLDHYSAAAAEEHLRRVADPLVAAVPPELIGSVFCDSIEVYDANWTPDLLVEFQKRWGYDAEPLLYKLVLDVEGADRLRIDFHRTLTGLYEQNFVAVFQRWAADHGLPFRIQGYGTPPAGVSSYRFADLYEGEGWGWKEITQTRWASSAAHIYGQNVVSSEVWTWVHSPSFRATPLDLKGEAHEHFLAGINKLIGHGWPYSSPDAPGLGWFFYAAGAIDDRNPWWPAMSYLTAYLSRLSWLLRQGDHVADVKIYVPVGDIYAQMGQGHGRSLDLWRETRDYVGAEIPRIVREAGFDFDLIDDNALDVIAPQDAPVVILPMATAVPAATLRWLDGAVNAGGTVVSIGAPGWAGDVPARIDDLGPILRRARRPDVTMTPPMPEVGIVHRRTDDGEIYFLANTGGVGRTFQFSPHTTRSHFEQWDASSGLVRSAGPVSSTVMIHLNPYEATVVVAFDGAETQISAEVSPGVETKRLLDGPWQVEFLDDPQSTGPSSVSLPHRWEADRTGYSDSAAYETTIHADPGWFDGRAAGPVLLDFGEAAQVDAGPDEARSIRGASYRAHLSPPVREVAVVAVNAAECGTLWAPPYVLDIGAYLQPGDNRLRIVVFNTAANALAEDTALGVMVEESVRRFGRRYRMQDLELALDSVASGLLAVPAIRWTAN